MIWKHPLAAIFWNWLKNLIVKSVQKSQVCEREHKNKEGKNTQPNSTFIFNNFYEREAKEKPREREKRKTEKIFKREKPENASCEK